MTDDNVPILDFSRICRLCLTEQPDVTSIFVEQPGVVPLPLRIMSCAPVEINAADSLPHQLCKYCLFQIDSWYKFKDLCENSDKTLHKLASGDLIDFETISKIQTNAREMMNVFEKVIQDIQITPEVEKVVLQGISTKSKIAFLECDQCYKYFSEESLPLHKAQIHKRKRKKSKISKPKLRTLIKIIDGSKNAVVRDDRMDVESSMICNICDAEFINNSELIEHLTCEHDITKENEPVEGMRKESNHGKPYEQEVSLYLDATNDDDANMQFCDECHMIFPNESELLVHKFTIHTKKSNKKKDHQHCPDCLKVFDTTKDLYKHISCKHGYRCSDCNDGFETADMLEAHKIERGDHQMRFQCFDCKMIFDEKNKLTQHLKEKKECGICAQVITKPQRLVRHMLIKHNIGVKKEYRCEECGKIFPYATSLKYHRRIHGKKDIYCAVCGKSFHFMCNYKVHVDLHHSSEEDKVVCELCGGLFPKCKIRDHLSRHSSPSFECIRCSKKFRLKTQLSKHFTLCH